MLVSKLFGLLVLSDCGVKVARSAVGVADVDVERMSLPVHTGASGLVLQKREDLLVGFLRLGLLAHGSKSVATLKVSGTKAQVRYADREKLEDSGVGKSWGGGVRLVVGVNHRAILGLSQAMRGKEEVAYEIRSCF